MLELEGTTLGHYQLQRRLARGGMSVVYLAYDTSVQRTVALKVVHRSDDDYTQRFQREVKTLDTLKHPHILATFEYGEHDQWCYFAMPYIEGGTLRERLAGGPLPLAEVSIIFEQLASALQYAHDHGIMHRDIKPANILLDNEQHIYLADFGLAKEIKAHNEHTQTGELIGTPEYLAPELTEEAASVSSDIYALGILLYHMLTGQVPFKASTPIATCWKHMLEQPVQPSLLNPAIPQTVEQVILCALEKNPQRRFRSVQAMAQAFKQALQASPYPQAISIGVPHRDYKADVRTIWPSRQSTSIIHELPHPALVGLVATVCFALSLSLGILTYKNSLPALIAHPPGANVVFFKASSLPHEVPPHLRPAFKTLVASNGNGSKINSSYRNPSNNLYSHRQSSISQNGYSNKQNNGGYSHRQRGGHRDKHKHGHKHRGGD